MLAFAAITAAALLYNGMSANVAERSVEWGTRRAAGMRAGMLARLVGMENLILAVFAIQQRARWLGCACAAVAAVPDSGAE